MALKNRVKPAPPVPDEDSSVLLPPDLPKYKPCRVYINWRVHLIAYPVLTYKDICFLAGMDANLNPSMVYRRAQLPKAEGILAPGQELTVQEDTVIDVTHTGHA